MKLGIFYVVIITFLLGCQPKAKSEPKGEKKTEVSAKFQGEEPTKPEQTEFYEPVPPKVTQNKNGVPSDAIVLFDGSGFDNWISASDSTAVEWHLNEDGSMTVKDKTGDIRTQRKFWEYTVACRMEIPERS